MPEIEDILRDVSRSFAGAHVNADEVLGAIRRRLREPQIVDEFARHSRTDIEIELERMKAAARYGPGVQTYISPFGNFARCGGQWLLLSRRSKSFPPVAGDEAVS